MAEGTCGIWCFVESYPQLDTHSIHWLSKHSLSPFYNTYYNLCSCKCYLQVTSAEVIPEGLRKFYDRFRYLQRTRMKVVAKRDDNVLKLLALWDTDLTHNGWSTFVDLQDSSDFIFAFQSTWKTKMMNKQGSSMIMLDATHNLVSNYFLSDGKKVSLYTFMIRDPLVGKGLPVAWAFNASASE